MSDSPIPSKAAGADWCATPIDRVALAARWGLATLEQHAEVGSTMERAREIASDLLVPLPAVVMADRQTAGRGRQGARWWQAPGSLAVSIVLDATRITAGMLPLAAAGPLPIWSLACGVSLAEAVTAVEPTVPARVRWPNDVYVQGKKLAGIIVESVAGGRMIFGIGVNTSGSIQTAPKALATKLITLPDLTGRAMPRTTLLAEFLPRFFQFLRTITVDPSQLVLRYRPLCDLSGQMVTIYRGEQFLHGCCRGIAADGSLLLDTKAGEMQITSGSLSDPAAAWRPDPESAQDFFFGAPPAA